MSKALCILSNELAEKLKLLLVIRTKVQFFLWIIWPMMKNVSIILVSPTMLCLLQCLLKPGMNGENVKLVL